MCPDTASLAKLSFQDDFIGQTGKVVRPNSPWDGCSFGCIASRKQLHLNLDELEQAKASSLRKKSCPQFIDKPLAVGLVSALVT